MILGTVFGLTAALTWSVANISIKHSAQRFGTWGSLIWTQLLGGLAVLLIAPFIEAVPDISDPETLMVIGAGGSI